MTQNKAAAWKTLGSTGHACAPGRCNHPDSADYNPDYVPGPEPLTDPQAAGGDDADAVATLAATGLARPAAPGEETCNAWTPFPGSICLALDGHTGNHAAYGPDGELCTTWPQDQTVAELADDPERAAYIIGLRKLADVLEQHPEVPLPANSGTEKSRAVLFGFYGPRSREELAAAVRAFPCAFAKDADGKWLNLDGKLAGLHVQLYASRDAVCTRRVVGTEEREVEVEVTPAVKEKRTETVEVVEWDCHPILADDKAAGR